MLLIQIKDFIQEHREVTLTRLAQKFDLPVNVMQDMLKIWVNKGVIGEQVLSSNCQTSSCGSGCGGCSFANNPQPEVIKYFWKGEPLGNKFMGVKT